ncbi:MAG: beta-N-acetylhexosaminidase, partial [Muribaculaceae bacterium]|nr:beta-N-acetylhexosaminidase [Muribaculaceae bacterium]
KPGVVETVLEIPAVTPGMRLPLAEIGYDYTVEFDVEGAPEEKGTVLFESPNATFWLSDPVEGNVAFSRESDLNSFRYNVLPGEKIHVKVTGNNETTRLYVNGKLIDDLNVLWLSYNNKNKIARVRTLVFPLDKAGRFNSKVSNLRVVNAFEQ